jgi:hypothetical protein
MNFILPTENRSFALELKLNTLEKREVAIVAQSYDPEGQAPPVYYLNRIAPVNGERTFTLKFPQSPELMKLSVFDSQSDPNHDNAEVEIISSETVDLPTADIWLKADDREFIEFAQKFAEQAKTLPAGRDGRPMVYESKNRKFRINYFDVIRDSKGNELSTPARVGHKTGNIDMAKSLTMEYTVPMMVLVLLHEYSHKYKNPDAKFNIGYETGADIHALDMYLSMGYPHIEAQRGFLSVFDNAKSEENHKRYKIINDFITKFANGKIKKINA